LNDETNQSTVMGACLSRQIKSQPRGSTDQTTEPCLPGGNGSCTKRKRHGQVETILTRQIIQLERQVDDLRKLYFGTISVPIMPNTEETTIHEHSNEINKKGNN
jgi:hypothetical protein